MNASDLGWKIGWSYRDEGKMEFDYGWIWYGVPAIMTRRVNGSGNPWISIIQKERA
jgi:hypothetical protein